MIPTTFSTSENILAFLRSKDSTHRRYEILAVGYLPMSVGVREFWKFFALSVQLLPRRREFSIFAALKGLKARHSGMSETGAEFYWFSTNTQCA